MNPRIQQIARDSGFAIIEDGVYGERWYSSKCGMSAEEMAKFAQMIVRECIDIVDQGGEFVSRPKLVERLQQHFGVER